MTWSIDDLFDTAPKSVFEMKLGAPVKPVKALEACSMEFIEWLLDRKDDKPKAENDRKEE